MHTSQQTDKQTYRHTTQTHAHIHAQGTRDRDRHRRKISIENQEKYFSTNL